MEQESLLNPTPNDSSCTYVGSNTRGKVLVADDKFMNIAALRNHFVELNLNDRVEYRSNGQEAIDYVKD